MKEQEEFGSDDEAQPKQAQSRRGRGANSKRIEVVGHRPFSKLCTHVHVLYFILGGLHTRVYCLIW